MKMLECKDFRIGVEFEFLGNSVVTYDTVFTSLTSISLFEKKELYSLLQHIY